MNGKKAKALRKLAKKAKEKRKDLTLKVIGQHIKNAYKSGILRRKV